MSGLAAALEKSEEKVRPDVAVGAAVGGRESSGSGGKKWEGERGVMKGMTSYVGRP